MTDWLPPALSYIPEWVGFQINQLDLPGAVIAIAHRGHLVCEHAFGVGNIVTNAALTPTQTFRVASHSKTFTSAGILKLVEKGRLRLDDSAGDYISGLHKEIARATLGQILSHTAGIIRDGLDGGQWADRRSFLDEAELLSALVDPPILDPNTRFKYSNHGFGLLGLVIKSVTGEAYNDWITREVVMAAGLSRTYPDADEKSCAMLCQGHSMKAPIGRRLVIPARNPANGLASATGFISSAGDLARFYAQLDPSAEKSFLTKESRREMMRRLWPIPEAAMKRYYGLGLIHGNNGDWPWFGHSGSFQGFASYTAALPDQDLTISVLTNAIDGRPAQIFDGIVHILQAFAKHGPPAKDIQHWKGRFWGLWGATDFVPIGDRIYAAAPAQLDPFADIRELTANDTENAIITKAGGLANFGEQARLIRDANGAITEIWLAADRLQTEKAFASELSERYRQE